MSEDTPTFAEWLKRRRKQLDLTQRELAACANCSAETIKKIEGGGLRPSKQLVEALAPCLEIPPEYRDQLVEFARGKEHPAGWPFGANGRAHGAQPQDKSHTETPAGRLPERITNLPAQPTSFIGREKEVNEARELLLRPEVRLLSMTGPGGTGKTRLAQEVAAGLFEHFPDGVFLVSLSGVGDPDLVIDAIAQIFDLRAAAADTTPLIDRLKAYLHDKRVLLILDNFEQVAQASAQIADLLPACPGLKVLVTSRTLLLAYGEYDFPVPPLDTPASDRHTPIERLAEYDAVRLFIERARAVRPDFDPNPDNMRLIAQICARLDGLPLAIELAAARTRILPLRSLLDKLSKPLDILTSGPQNLPPRQQTLRNAIGWSYNLLGPAEQRLFRWLSVFVGGSSLGATEAVIGSGEAETAGQASTAPDAGLSTPILDRLESLLNNSLLRQQSDGAGESRFWMLETIREYGLERLLESGESEAICRRHAEFYRELAEQAEQELQGTKQREWLDRLEREYDNLRAAITYSLDNGDLVTAASIAGSLRRFWYLHAHIGEGRSWLARILALGDEVPDHLRAKLLHAEGLLAWSQGDYASSRSCSQQALEIWEALGDRRGIASMKHNLAIIAMFEGDYATASALHSEALGIFLEFDERWSAALTLANLGQVALNTGDYEQARLRLEESLVARRALGDTQGVAQSLNNLGTVMRCMGDFDMAYDLHKQGLAIFQEWRDTWSCAVCMANMGFVEMNREDVEEARSLFKESLDIFVELGVKQGIATCLNGLGEVAAQTAELRRAALLFGAAEGLVEAIGSPLPLPEKLERDRSLEVTRTGMGAEAFARASGEGRRMGLEEAVALAREV